MLLAVALAGHETYDLIYLFAKGNRLSPLCRLLGDRLSLEADMDERGVSALQFI